MKKFSPASLNHVQHQLADLTLKNRDVEADQLFKSAMADVETFLRGALDPHGAFEVISATAAARMAAVALRNAQPVDAPVDDVAPAVAAVVEDVSVVVPPSRPRRRRKVVATTAVLLLMFVLLGCAGDATCSPRNDGSLSAAQCVMK